MKEINENKQMKDVWKLPAVAKWETKSGKHPTQKPLSVLSRIILSSTSPGNTILDPFTGTSTTGISANLLGRNFVGIDNDDKAIELSKLRKIELDSKKSTKEYISKMRGFKEGQLQRIIEEKL